MAGKKKIQKKDLQELEKLRRRIDELDARLLRLLNERARYSAAIGTLKAEKHLPIYDPDREETIFRRLVELNTGPLSGKAVIRLFERIIDESRLLQKHISLGLQPKIEEKQTKTSE